MELNRGNIIKYNNTLYTVVAVVFKTVYLQKSNSTKERYDYTLDEIKEFYHVEFFKENKNVKSKISIKKSEHIQIKHLHRNHG